MPRKKSMPRLQKAEKQREELPPARRLNPAIAREIERSVKRRIEEAA